MITVRDRYIGSLLGLHVGDAIWAPFETDNLQEVAESLKMLNGLQFKGYKNPWPEDDNGEWLPAGRPTDDSDQTADLCHSLLEYGGLNADHLRASLQRSVNQGKSRLWKGAATGAGRTTKRALSTDELEQVAAHINPFPSNGSLMRSAPLALWQGPSTEEDVSSHSPEYIQVATMSRVTHTHPDSIAACWLFIRMLRNALADRDITDFTVHNALDERIRYYLEEIENGHGLPEDPGSFSNGWGGAEYTLKVALHTIQTTNTFTETIQEVGLAGGDTDTYGAVAGALAGAMYGTKSIPKKWTNAVLGRDQMQQYAERMYVLRFQKKQ
jgi:ADP-ribosyl-[dinitrogen reductase] hydrolase